MASFRNGAALQVEVLALRHQLGVLHRSVKRPKLTAADRLFWAWLSELWSDWRTALVIVQPETVVAWHRKSFRLFAWARSGGPRMCRAAPGPGEDASGYESASALTQAADLKDKLLLIHNLEDDNVHFQNTVQLKMRWSTRTDRWS